MSWSDIYGHEWQKDFFKRTLRAQRIAHAYLFFGPPRIGKSTFALELAKTLCCLVLRDEESCGYCRSCVLFHAQSHPDLVMLSPSGDSVKIDEVREFVKNLNLKRTMSPFKVGILTAVEQLTEEASNCLLKTIEEPPAGSVLFLTTSRLYAILPTIVSRVQLVEFSPLPKETVKRYLIEREYMQEEEAGQIASLSMGSIGRALEILGGREIPIQKIWRFWKSLRNGEPITSLGQWFGAMELDEMVYFFSFLECYLRDVLLGISVGVEDEELFFQRGWSREALEEARYTEASLVIRVIRLLEELTNDLSLHVQPDIAIIDFLGKVRGEIENAMGSRDTVRR